MGLGNLNETSIFTRHYAEIVVKFIIYFLWIHIYKKSMLSKFKYKQIPTNSTLFNVIVSKIVCLHNFENVILFYFMKLRILNKLN